MRAVARTVLVVLAGVAVLPAAPPPARPPPDPEDLVPLIPARPRRKEPAPRALPGGQAERLRALPVPDDAVRLALQDLSHVPPYDRRYMRYLWVPSAADPNARELPDDCKAATLVLGVISRAVAPGVRPVPVAGGQVLRVDLRLYATRRDDLGAWLSLWEDLRYDPDFNLLITRDELEFAEKLAGRPLDAEHVSVDVVRIDGPHIDPAAYRELQRYTRSAAPVLNWRYFARRVLTTVKDKGVFAVIWSGRYYEFRGVRRSKDPKVSDLDLFLEDRGLGFTKAGFTAAKLFEKLRSDQRAALFRSGVTGKPRLVEWLHSPDSRDGTGWVSITHDLANKDVDVGTHPVYNLLDFRAAAFEVIAEGGNGFHVYGIFDGTGKLLDVADATNVVADRTVPGNFTPSLQCADSCIACHENSGDVGVKPVTNDVKRLLAGRLDVFGDLSREDAFGFDTVNRLAGLYAGNFTKAMRRARDDYDETVLRCAGPWKGNRDQVNVVRTGMGRVIDGERGYWYDAVDARTALGELGVWAPRAKAQAVLNALLLPDPGAVTGPYLPENPVIGAIKAGVTVNRSDWDLQKGFAALRSQKQLATLRAGGR